MGLDGIRPRLLKSAASIIALSLTKILNLSISSGIFLMQWKISKICPVHKGGRRSDKSNYRPIAILYRLLSYMFILAFMII